MKVHKIRKTKQKEIIKEEIEKISTLFTADELYERIKKVNTKIGIATVYRFLKKLKQQGNLHSYLCKRKTVYSKEKISHCHFVCEKCNQINHFDVKSLDFLKLKEKICHFQIEVYGTCEKCMKNEEKH